MRLIAPTLVLAVINLVAATSSAQTPVGPEFQVNSYTTNHQSFPAVAVGQQGDFVVVWHSFGSDNGDTSYSVQGQRFSAQGTPQGAQFLVNSYTTNSQSFPAVAIGQQGDFVVVWNSSGSDNGDISGFSVQGQRFTAQGIPQGAQFLVNSYTTNNQHFPAVAVDQQSDFVVVWMSNGSDNGDTDNYSVQGQRFNAAGIPQGTQFQVNSFTTNRQGAPAVAVDQQGDFVVVWNSYGSDNGDASDTSVQGQRFNAGGTPQGAQFQVNSYTTNSQRSPAVAVDQQGDFVVVWHSYGSDNGDTSRNSVQGQRFNAQGTPQGAQFQVNSFTTNFQSFPAVAVDQQGDFVVVWNSSESDNGDTSGYSVQGQRFNAQGTPQGPQFQVNSYTTNHQRSPAVAVDQQGDFVVVWRSLGSDNGDTSAESVQGQRLRVTGDIGDRVWEDHDFDGLQGLPEPGVEGVRINLYDQDSTLQQWTETDAMGDYAFRAKPGTYYLEFELPNDFSFTLQDIASDDTIDSDADLAFGQTIDFDVAEAVADLTWDAGIVSLIIFADGFETGDTSAWQ